MANLSSVTLAGAAVGVDKSGSGGGQTADKPSVKELLSSLPYGPAPESPAVAEAWLDDHGRSFGHFIGNQWVKPEGRKTYDSFNPATGQRLATTLQGKQVGPLEDIMGIALWGCVMCPPDLTLVSTL